MNLQTEAKARSETFLRARGIRVNEGLPFIEAPSELRPASAQDVARRSLVLGYMIGIGFRQPGSRLKGELEKWGLYPSTSAAERTLLAKQEYAEQEIVDATWLTECVQSLGWASRRSITFADATMTSAPSFRSCETLPTLSRRRGCARFRTSTLRAICSIVCIGLRAMTGCMDDVACWTKA